MELLFNGHINRNIRAILTMADLSKPYIVHTMKKVTLDSAEVTFKVNGCIDLDYAGAIINDYTTIQLESKGFCNHLLTERDNSTRLLQSEMKLTVNKGDRVILTASVDSAMQTSVNPANVQPVQFANKPQTHFARLRLEESYSYEHKGHFVNGGKMLKVDLTNEIADLFNYQPVAIKPLT